MGSLILGIRRRVPRWAKVLCFVVFVLLCLGLAALGIGGAILGSLAGSVAGANPNAGSKAYRGPAGAYVAKISVVGEIGAGANNYYSSDGAYHHDWTLETIDGLMGDSNNVGIFLYLDTPGGAVYESDELYLKLMEYKEETGRPIYAYFGQIAASGGYYVAAAADGIFANRNSWTGSIGVTLGTMFDVSGFLEEHGIKTDTIVSGRNKAMGSYYEPLSEEQREIYQGLVDEAYGQFVDIVALGRGLDEAAVRELADGRIYTAAQALEAGLIDGIFGEKEGEAEILAKFEDGVVVDECYYRADANYFSLFGTVFGQGGGILQHSPLANAQDDIGGDVAAVLDLMERSAEAGGLVPMYLYGG